MNIAAVVIFFVNSLTPQQLNELRKILDCATKDEVIETLEELHEILKPIV